MVGKVGDEDQVNDRAAPISCVESRNTQLRSERGSMNQHECHSHKVLRVRLWFNSSGAIRFIPEGMVEIEVAHNAQCRFDVGIRA